MEDAIDINEFMEKLVSILNERFSDIEGMINSLRTDVNRIRIDISDTKDDLSSLEIRMRTELNALRQKLENESNAKVKRDILEPLEG